MTGSNHPTTGLLAAPAPASGAEQMREALEICAFWLEVALAPDESPFEERELSGMRNAIKQADAALGTRSPRAALTEDRKP